MHFSWEPETQLAVCQLTFGARCGFDHIFAPRMALLRSLSEGPLLGIPRPVLSALANQRSPEVSLSPPAVQTHHKVMIGLRWCWPLIKALGTET